MIGRIVEIASDNRHISLDRGFLVVGGEAEDARRTPIDDLAAVIGNAHGLTYSNSVLVALAQRGVPFVLCGANHSPVGFLISVEGNWEQAKRFDRQIEASKPLRNRLWAQVIRTKLLQQAHTLVCTGSTSRSLVALAKKVRVGDPENIEAQGARRYWGLLFGENFRRDRQAGGINALLNYGYTVLRAATARSVLAAGLHPTVGLHHANEVNAMRLVDDLSEPFRPVIDLQVWELARAGTTDVTSEAKRCLVNSLFCSICMTDGEVPVMNSLHRLAISLAQVYMGDRDRLDLPLPALPVRNG
jgi:CRISPR-associated protein Cas1